MYNQKDIHSPDNGSANKSFAEIIISEADLVKPMLSEQLLRKFIIGEDDTGEILSIYLRAFNMDAKREVRLVILKPSGAKDSDDFFFLKNTAQQYVGEENLYLCTILNDFVVIVTSVTEQEKIGALLDKIRSAVTRCYRSGIMAIYSETVHFEYLPEVYERLKVCTGYSFYADSNGTMFEGDIEINSGSVCLRPQYGAIEHAVKSGDSEKVTILLAGFFKKLRKVLPSPAVAKTFCLELYVSIIRCCGIDKIDRYMNGIETVQEAKTLSDIENYIEEKGLEITRNNAPETDKIYSSLVRDTIRIIDQNIENENLSLRWLAGTILYTNVDYLGKLFKKETGKNFSHYVMEKRMEMAKDLILEGKKDRIYEVAENVGYGSNSQYFSQVFKKYTGISPLEYKEFARLTRDRELQANNS
ncbi:MAG: helix-turn-helix transcriptional regulator [Clostridia bacterium]|nr:helix-turn-helix transcriptional regulator [Clostridia bacterium]